MDVVLYTETKPPENVNLSGICAQMRRWSGAWIGLSIPSVYSLMSRHHSIASGQRGNGSYFWVVSHTPAELIVASELLPGGLSPRLGVIL